MYRYIFTNLFSFYMLLVIIYFKLMREDVSLGICDRTTKLGLNNMSVRIKDFLYL